MNLLCLAFSRCAGLLCLLGAFLVGFGSAAVRADEVGFRPICGGSQTTQLDEQFKIIEGAPAFIRDHPWIATIAYPEPRNSSSAHLCGAVVVGDRWLLTAGHCVWDCAGLEQRIVAYVAGDVYDTEANGDETALNGPIAIKNVYVFPDFGARRYVDNGQAGELIVPRNDIAIVEVDANLLKLQNVTPAALATGDQLRSKIAGGGTGTVAGFGRRRAFGGAVRRLLEMEAKVYPNTLCNIPTVLQGNLASGEMICAGDADSRDRACKGDSGSGLVADVAGRPVLFGLVSWKRDCDLGIGLGAYTNVANYASWISGVLR